MSVKIYAPVEARLIEIWDYTFDQWGEDQADTYIRGLIEAIHTVHRQRYRWRPVIDDALRGVWFIRHEHHYMFFRELSDGSLGIISILHESMNIPMKLKEDVVSGTDESP